MKSKLNNLTYHTANHQHAWPQGEFIRRARRGLHPLSRVALHGASKLSALGFCRAEETGDHYPGVDRHVHLHAVQDRWRDRGLRVAGHGWHIRLLTDSLSHVP